MFVRTNRSLCQALVLVCALLLALPGVASAIAEDGPRACVQAVGTSVDNADLETFKDCVDIDAILNQAVDDLDALANNPQTSQWIPAGVSLFLSQGMLKSQAIRGLFIREIREFVYYGVGSGNFGGYDAGSSYKSRSMLAPLFNMASTGRKEIRDVGAAAPVANGWHVPFVVHDANGRDYRVKALVQRIDGRCKVTGIANMQDIILELCLEAQD